jgi:tetratricopeptide (TPR) repeat protein
VPPVPFFSALFHCTEARREVARRVRALEQRAGAAVHAAPLFEEAEAAAAYPDAERAFVEFCERLVRAALRDGTRMVIVLSHVPNADPAEVDASLRRLATATVSSRVKLVVIEPRDKRPSPPIEMRTAVFAFDLDADAIERGLHERLADDDLTDVERLRFTTAASGWALSKGDAHLAMVYSLDALAQAQEMDDPREGLVAYYNLGNTLHQCQEYAEAARMYGEVAQTGMDDGQWVLAAQGLMGLGNTHFMREDPELADLSYEAAQALFASQNLRHFEAHALTWRGEAAVLAGRHGDALGFFESALKTCDAMDPSYASTTRSAKADVLLRIARLYELAGRPDQQREYQQQAREHGAAAPACHHP